MENPNWVFNSSPGATNKTLPNWDCLARKKKFITILWPGEQRSQAKPTEPISSFRFRHLHLPNYNFPLFFRIVSRRQRISQIFFSSHQTHLVTCAMMCKQRPSSISIQLNVRLTLTSSLPWPRKITIQIPSNGWAASSRLVATAPAISCSTLITSLQRSETKWNEKHQQNNNNKWENEEE